jgi:hypothetical protein
VQEGRTLARGVGQLTPVLTRDLGAGANQHFPVQMGRFLVGMTERAEEKRSQETGRVAQV